jgi:hypothetical protein
VLVVTSNELLAALFDGMSTASAATAAISVRVKGVPVLELIRSGKIQSFISGIELDGSGGVHLDGLSIEVGLTMVGESATVVVDA